MKGIFLKLALAILPLSTAIAQEAAVEESVWGIQTGFLGTWAHNEYRLAGQLALRSEVGLDATILGGSLYDGNSIIFVPVITLEPRWYYNLGKRNARKKNISGNAGNFVSLPVSYNPDWFAISDLKNVRALNQVSVIPTWGIKRNLGAVLNYEAGIGLGYRYIFAKSAGYRNNKGEAALNLHLRIGYKF
ncbi:MAG TPA: hypothetical protein ENJ95_06520 [Bacteroidetes bacterium]|nr:hypothetical protein [Bacteroidota bacterium]